MADKYILLGGGGFALKLYSNIFNVTLPAVCDPVIIGIILNFIGIFIGSAITKVTEKEKEERAKLFIVPDEEKDPVEKKKTLSIIRFAPFLGVIVTVVLVVVWVIPYALTK